MSTRSLIGKQQDDGSIRYIYCHWDGYPEHNGKILSEHYTDERKVNALLDLGNLSAIEAELGEQHDFNDLDHPNRDSWCLAYGRDRGESKQEARTCTLAQFLACGDYAGVEYVYLFVGTWQVYKVTSRSLNAARLDNIVVSK